MFTYSAPIVTTSNANTINSSYGALTTTITAMSPIAGVNTSLSATKACANPKHWLHGRKPPGTDDFEDCKQLFLSDMRINHYNHFHVLIWEKSTDCSYYGTVQLGEHSYLAFGNKADLYDFETWVAEYEAKFFENCERDQTFIPLLSTGEISGMYVGDFHEEEVEDEGMKLGDISQLVLEDWAWITQNCNYPVFRVNNGWLFKSNTDAVYFKCARSD